MHIYNRQRLTKIRQFSIYSFNICFYCPFNIRVHSIANPDRQHNLAIDLIQCFSSHICNINL